MLNRHIVTLDADWRIEGMELEQGLIDGAYRRDYQPRDYMTATAPVTVQSALEMAGKIPDPRQGFNCLELSWIEKKEWWFFNEFRTPPTTGGQRVFVRFEGITYQAEVWVNGVQAGLLRGMFRSDDIDVTDLLNGDVNRLTLRVRAQERCWDERSGSALRAQIPVAQSMFGWNWCPSIFCIGLCLCCTWLLVSGL